MRSSFNVHVSITCWRIISLKNIDLEKAYFSFRRFLTNGNLLAVFESEKAFSLLGFYLFSL